MGSGRISYTPGKIGNPAAGGKALEGEGGMSKAPFAGEAASGRIATGIFSSSAIFILFFVILFAPGAASEEKKLPHLPTGQLGDADVALGGAPQNSQARGLAAQLGPSAVQALANSQRFSISMRDADLRELLFGLGELARVNIVMDPDVQGTVTVNLTEVTFDEALNSILQPLGFQHRLEGRLLRIGRPQMVTRFFDLRYVNAQRSATRGLSASSAGTTGGIAGAVGGGAAGGGATGGGSSASVSSTSTEDIYKELEDGLKLLMSEGGKFTINRMAGKLMVTDFPEVLEKVAAFLEVVESATQRQVRIESKILEVELNDAFQAGINWDLVLGNSASLRQVTSPTSQGVFQLGVSFKGFSAILDALSQQGKVNVLSSPVVSTMNNSTAVLRAGTQDVFFESSSVIDVTTGRLVQTSVQPRPITEGVVLDVTPYVSDDGFITMNIQPSVTERAGQAVSRFGDTFPILNVRDTNSTIRLRDGQTVVIAGLMQDRELINRTKVPLLGDIPLLGGIFRRVERSKRKTDLVILITPRVLTAQGIEDFTTQDLRRQEELRQRQKP